MKIILVLIIGFALHISAMAQEPATPVPTGSGMPTQNPPPSDKALVDQTHKPESAFEGHEKVNKKAKKKHAKKKHFGKKHRKNKKPQA